LFTDTDWKPVSRPVLFGSALAALSFCIYALMDDDGFLFSDYVNLPFHEFGHLFFGLFGETLGMWGGTVMQLLIPFGIFISFLLRKETGGVFFSSFWFGENLLHISVYINDARTMALPLVGGGEHDWNRILGSMDMLGSDHYIAGAVRVVGWLVMLASTTWFLVTGFRQPPAEYIP